MKYRPSLLRSAEEKNKRMLRLGIRNNDETVIELIFMAFVNIIVNI